MIGKDAVVNHLNTLFDIALKRVSGSNLNQEAGYTDKGDCPQFIQPMKEWHLKLDHYHFLPFPIKFIIHQSVYHN
jgi:hypothetical protein